MTQIKNRISLFLLSIAIAGIIGCSDAPRKADINNDGGMSFILEASIADIIRSRCSDKNDTAINIALINAAKIKITSEKSFAEIFTAEMYKNDAGNSLTSRFKFEGLKENPSSADLLKFIQHQTDETMEKLKQILLKRVDKFGIENPVIQRVGNEGRLMVQLPGMKQSLRLHELLLASANLEFWETYENKDVYPFLATVNTRLKEILSKDDKIDEADKTIETDSTMSLTEQMAKIKSVKNNSLKALKKENPLFAVFSPSIENDGSGKNALRNGPVIGFAAISDTAVINSYLNKPEIRSVLQRQLKFLWSFKPVDKEGTTLQLIAVRDKNEDGKGSLSGDIITEAHKTVFKKNPTPYVSIKMTSEASFTWERLTKDNIGKSIAIVIGDKVYSFPTIQGEIKGGTSSISGNFTVEETDDFVNLLNAGSLPVKLSIIQEKAIAPLGKQ